MNVDRTIVNPPEWKKPIGYSNGVLTTGGKTLYLAGQVAFDADAHVVGKDDLVAQFRQVLTNMRAVCHAGGAKLEDIVRMTIFVQNRDEYRAKAKELGQVYREFFGKHFPAMTLVEIARFFEDDVLIEIESIAVVGA